MKEKMFNNNEELYSWVNGLIDQLKGISQDEWASAFNDALRVWGTSGEILGSIRIVLFDFQKSQIPKKLGIQREVKNALKALDKALRQRPWCQ